MSPYPVRTLTVLMLAWFVMVLPVTSRAQPEEAMAPAQAETMPTTPQETEMLYEDIDESKWTFPGHGAQKSTRPDQVFLAFPHDKAIFAKGSAVTLGWQPVRQTGLTIAYYEVIINNSLGQPPVSARTGSADEDMVTTYLFFPRAAGTYFWTVNAITVEGVPISSEGRYFQILD